MRGCTGARQEKEDTGNGHNTHTRTPAGQLRAPLDSWRSGQSIVLSENAAAMQAQALARPATGRRDAPLAGCPGGVYLPAWPSLGCKAAMCRLPDVTTCTVMRPADTTSTSHDISRNATQCRALTPQRAAGHADPAHSGVPQRALQRPSSSGGSLTNTVQPWNQQAAHLFVQTKHMEGLATVICASKLQVASQPLQVASQPVAYPRVELQCMICVNVYLQTTNLVALRRVPSEQRGGKHNRRIVLQ